MKYPVAILFSLVIAFLSGCKDESREKRIIHQAESLFDIAPDSVLLILDSIPLPEELSPSLATQWSMLYARAADKTGKEMPYVSQLQVALSYYKNKKQWPEIAETGLYLGRSYVENKEYEKAMQAYSDALQVSLEIEDYNRAGYICSYMGDLYQVDGDHLTAANKYEKGNSYFQQAGNTKSYAFGLVNAAFCYAIEEDDHTALSLLHKADSVATSLNDPEVMAYVYNGLGNIYINLKKYSIAESYILKGMQLDSIDVVSDYLALAEIYFYKKEKQKAKFSLKKAETLPPNEFTTAFVYYMHYKLNKDELNYEQALSNLEQYLTVADSVDKVNQSMNILEVEKKHKHIQLQNENKQLKIDQQRNYILLSILFSICASLFIIYLLMTKQKNQHIWKQKQVINEQNKKIYITTIELQQKNKALQQQLIHIQEAKSLIHLQGCLEEENIKYQQLRETVDTLNNNLILLKKERLLLSPISKKLHKMSQTVKPNNTHSLITDHSWHTIEEQISEVYPALCDQMRQIGLTTTERRFCYLTLFLFDTTAIAVLLNIAPESVNKQRLRVRQKFNLVGKSMDLYEYLVTL